jgi:hypothetical protein
MTRESAYRALRTLAGGLPPAADAVSRFMERVSVTDDPEALRYALAEIGARSVLESAPQSAQEPLGRVDEPAHGIAGADRG